MSAGPTIAIDTQSTRDRPTGIGVYTRALLAALQRVAPERRFVELDWGKQPPMRLHRRLYWQQLELPQRAAAAGASLLHVPGFDAPLRKPCPVVLTVHDLIGMRFPQHLPPVARFYWACWLPNSIRAADRIIADSAWTRTDLLRLVGADPERIHVIPLAADPRFRPQPAPGIQALRARLDLPEQFVLYVGTIEPRKGLDTLIAAWQQLAELPMPISLLLSGKTGWYTSELEQQIATCDPRRPVRLLGYIADSDLAALYSAASLFVFPSHFEGFGLPPLEAMACGTPVVCSAAAALPEVVGEAALSCDAGDVRALAALMHLVLTQPALAQTLRQRGLERARLFSWEQTARLTLAVYDELGYA